MEKDRLPLNRLPQLQNPPKLSDRDRLSDDELARVRQEIGKRLIEAFDTDNFSEIARQLQTTPSIAKLYCEGNRFPAPEFQLQFRRVTGISIDWLMTGEGPKYVKLDNKQNEPLFSRDEEKEIWQMARDNGRSFLEQTAKLATAGLKFLEKFNSWKKD